MESDVHFLHSTVIELQQKIVKMDVKQDDLSIQFIETQKSSSNDSFNTLRNSQKLQSISPDNKLLPSTQIQSNLDNLQVLCIHNSIYK